MSDAVLRRCGAVLLVSLIGLAAISRVDRSGIPIDFGGTIERYGDDSIFVSTSTTGLLAVRVTSGTVVREGDMITSIAALRPGRRVAVQGAHDDSEGRLTARQLIVLGPSQ